MLVGAFNVGDWLTKLMVSANDVLEDAMPSLTEIVIVAVPNVFVKGLRVTVRLLLLPPKTMLVFGTRLVLDDAAESVSAAAEVSASPIVKAIGPADVFSFVVWFGMPEITGRPLTEKTALSAFARPAALAVN